MADKEAKEKKIEAAAPGKKAEKRPKGSARLREKFEKEVKPALMKEFELKNPMAVPHLHKIVVNMGVGEATQNAKVIDPAVNEMGAIVGQKPPAVSHLNPRAPRGLCSLCDKLMCKRPEERPATAADVAALLRSEASHLFRVEHGPETVA